MLLAAVRDPDIGPIMKYFFEGALPEDSQVAAKLIVQALLYIMADGVLYYIVHKKDSVPKVVAPSEYKKKLMEEYHAGVMSCDFAGPRISLGSKYIA